MSTVLVALRRQESKGHTATIEMSPVTELSLTRYNYVALSQSSVLAYFLYFEKMQVVL